MNEKNLIGFFMVTIPLWCFLAYLVWEWWTLRRIPDPQPGDIWRSQHSGRAFRVEQVGLTDTGTLTWDFCIETASGQFNMLPMTGYGRRDWRLTVRDEKRVKEKARSAEAPRA